MPSPTERLELAIRLLADGSVVGYGAACHAAHYAAAHHIAACLGRTMARGEGNSISHESLKKLMMSELSRSPLRADWSGLPTLQDYRLRADYRDNDPPSADEAAIAVELAAAILATD